MFGRRLHVQLIGAMVPGKKEAALTLADKSQNGLTNFHLRGATTKPSGAILPEPKKTRFGFLGVLSSVVAGLLIGATLSKMMANFLEEKELFVPSDDDDDDD